jgi:hypothetical protein
LMTFVVDLVSGSMILFEVGFQWNYKIARAMSSQNFFENDC